MPEAVLAYALQCVDEASPVMDKVRSAIGLLGSSMSDLGGGFSALGTVMTGFAAGGGVGAAIAGLGEAAKAVQWSIEQASEAEQAWNNLAGAVERSGTAWETVKDKTQEYALQIQSTTKFSDEAVAGMIERLLTFGMTYEEAMKAIGAAVDLAAAKHMDLQAASDVVGKAFMGNTALLKRYGVDVEETGGKAASFTDILGKLNEQFGGAAATQAETYVGTQERFKNAVSELGEKLGTIFLPALTTLTDKMIPVVDALGKGVEAIQAWVTEVGKMPEVKEAVDAAGGAFEGFMKYMADLWKYATEALGPALTDLWDAFKEISDAVAPIAEAVKELMGAFGDTGNFDIFKTAISLIVIEIKGFAEIIKLIAPAVKIVADAFKEAADFIAPPLKTIVDAVRAFIDTIKGAFQGFYDWLVGKSLWTDMWQKVLDVTAQVMPNILNAVTKQLVDPLNNTMTSLTQGISGAWNVAIGAIQGSLSSTIGQMQTLTSAMAAPAALSGGAWAPTMGGRETTVTGVPSPTVPGVLSLTNNVSVLVDGQSVANAISNTITSQQKTEGPRLK